MRIAVDAMGGDYAPVEIVEGALETVKHLNADDRIILVGDEVRILEILGESSRWQDKISVVHAPEVIEMHDSPVDSLRKKPKNSIAIMAKLAKEGEADIVLSAGNTGACVASCQMRMRLLPEVQRPGIMVTFPTLAGPLILCDVGANVAPKASHLYQYGLMCDVYAREVLGTANPTLGLINIGEEESKGTGLAKEVNQLFRADKSLNFIGNIEPRDLLNKPADILVCDGFAGNIILKLTEGIAEAVFKFIGNEVALQKPELLPQFAPIVEQIYKKHDYSEYGGAPLLGVDGICIICHGNSDRRTIKNAILAALKHGRLNINEKIVARLAR